MSSNSRNRRTKKSEPPVSFSAYFSIFDYASFLFMFDTRTQLGRGGGKKIEINFMKTKMFLLSFLLFFCFENNKIPLEKKILRILL